MDSEKPHHHTFIVTVVAALVEWGNRRLTLSHWLFKGGEFIFVKVEAMMLILTAFCVTLPFWVERIPREFHFLFYQVFLNLLRKRIPYLFFRYFGI